MSLLQEIPRRPGNVPKLHRLQFAELETRRQIEDFKRGISDQSLSVGEPMSVSGHAFSVQPETIERPIVPPTPVFTGVRLADRRAVVINTLIASPDEPATQTWIDVMHRHYNRILRFARTAVNKGRQVDPVFR